MNKKDLKVVSYLRQNGRMTLTNLSRKTHIPISTIFDRIKSNHNGIIKRHTTILNLPKLGFHSKAYVMIRINKKDKQNIKEFLKLNPNVNTLYKINNGFDYMLECIFRNINDLEHFLEYFEEKFSIKTKNVYYVIDHLKEEGFFSDPEMVDMLIAEWKLGS